MFPTSRGKELSQMIISFIQRRRPTIYYIRMLKTRECPLIFSQAIIRYKTKPIPLAILAVQEKPPNTALLLLVFLQNILLDIHMLRSPQ